MQLTTQQKQKFLEYMEKKRLNSTATSPKTATKADKSLDLISWVIEELNEELLKIEGLSPELKAKMNTSSFKEVLFGELFGMTMDRLTDYAASNLDFRFIKAWKESESAEEQEFLLRAEMELNPNFVTQLLHEFIESYLIWCVENGVKHNPLAVYSYYLF